MNKPKVFLTGGDNINWALDDDLKLTKQVLEEIVEFSSIQECDVIHCVAWTHLITIPESFFAGKKVICHVQGEPYRYLSLSHGHKALKLVGKWITQSTQAQQQLDSFGFQSKLIPYSVDLNIFHPLEKNNSDIIKMQTHWNIPSDSYIIGNFHRDTEGHDFTKPKLVKGPDVFIEIVRSLKKRNHNIHVLLAGPRRFWIRQQLNKLQIPYTFVGELLENQDDIDVNILPRKTLNTLYNLLDLYLVTSRSEGGPRSILESSASRCKIISTKVGLANDVLQPMCMYDSPTEAVDIIERDIQSNFLSQTPEHHYKRVQQTHHADAIKPLMYNLYQHLDKVPTFAQQKDVVQNRDLKKYYNHVLEQTTYLLRHNWVGKLWRVHLKTWIGQGKQRIFSLRNTWNKKNDAYTVSLWHQFFKPPYGGGNQFMLALRKALHQQGINAVENQLHPGINAYLLNSIHFDIDSFLKFKKEHDIYVVHRIDGPIHLIRGRDSERKKDELCFSLNAELAAATVIQSTWTYQRIVEMGYHPINAVIIHNGVDSDIFHRHERISFSFKRKVRLISSSWSDNPRKGGPIYKWLDQNLDWSRFEYTFVGRASETFNNIKQVAPVPSEKLADILRQHDIYITASQKDPCSNALIEALACGLPALYLNDGGHPELVGFGGLPFNQVDEILPQLEVLCNNYEMYQNLIVISHLDDVAEKYLALLKKTV